MEMEVLNGRRGRSAAAAEGKEDGKAVAEDVLVFGCFLSYRIHSIHSYSIKQENSHFFLSVCCAIVQCIGLLGSETLRQTNFALNIPQLEN